MFGTGVYSILEMLKKRLQNIVWDASQALSFRNKRIRISGEFGVFVQKTEWKVCISIKNKKVKVKPQITLTNTIYCYKILNCIIMERYTHVHV